MSHIGINTSLVYLSRSNIVFDQPALKDLETQAARKNAAINVHGILISRGSRFLQYLEGPDDTLNALMDCIERDERHSVQRVVYTGRRSYYRFAKWNMRVLQDDNGDLELWSDSLTVALKMDDATAARALVTSLIERVAATHG